MGVRYEARDAPTLEVLFGPLQMYLAFHSEVYKHHTTSNGNTLSPGLTGSRHRSPCPKTRITAFSEDYHRPAAPSRHAAVWVDPQVVICRAGLAHRQLIHILQHCRHKCQEAQMSDFHRWLQVYHTPHTHLAHLTPNQHTLTCRSINDLVLKWPAYPQIGDILRILPFLSPIEQVYLELPHTAGCEAEALFHNLFIKKSTYWALGT